MRKIIFLIATILISLGLIGYILYDVTDKVEKSGIVVENVISMDKEYMTLHYSDVDSLKWFECCILMDDWLDAEIAPGIYGISNVFQIEEKSDTTANTICHVILLGHTASKDTIAIRAGFWVEDIDLNQLDTLDIISFADAYDILNRANVQKPHSKHVVLRKAIGPNHYDTYNPQYIFGNAECHYYIDAVTGELNTIDPSGIPEDGGDDPYFDEFFLF